MNNSDWLPIESAPKDGTEVLLLSNGDMDFCRWSEMESVWVDRGMNDFPNPTHYMIIRALTS